MDSASDRTHATHTNLSGQIEGADVGWWIAEVREALDSLAARVDILARICATPGLGERFVIEEGPFVGDAPAALETTRLWLERSGLMLTSPARSMAQAHVAASGLASRK